MESQRGQVLLEFVLSAILASICLIAATGVFIKEWQRFHCLHQVFESTHASVITGVERSSSNKTVVRELARSFRGETVCGEKRESVELPTLEFAQWI
jgi:hypothetical protein